MSSQQLPTRDYPLKFPVKEERLTDQIAYFGSGNQLGGSYLLLAIFILVLLVIISFITVSGIVAAISPDQGPRSGSGFFIPMVILNIALFFAIRYLTTWSILHQSVCFDTVAQEVELQNRFVRVNGKWFVTLTEKVPFSKIDLIQYRVLNPSESIQVCVEIKIFHRKPIQLTYKTNDSKAQEVTRKLAHWISTVEKHQPLIKRETKEEQIETDIVNAVLQNAKSLSFVPITTWLGLIILPIFFTHGRAAMISELVFLGCAGVFSIIFHRTVANTIIVLIYSIWIYPIYSQIFNDWVLPLFTFLPFIMIPSYRAWLSYNQVKRSFPDDPRFNHWQNKAAQQYFPVAGLLLTGAALLGWFLTTSMDYAVLTVQEGMVHTAVFGFTLGVASWLSGYPNKIASIAASVLGGTTIILWLINQFGGII